MERDSSTDSDTYMEDDDYRPFTSSPCLKPLLTIASIAMVRRGRYGLASGRYGCSDGSRSIATSHFMEREHHPKQEGLADVLNNMSEMEFFKQLRLTRKSFDDTLDLIPKAYVSEMFGVSQTTVFECVQRLIDVLCEAGEDVFFWPTPSQIPEIEQEFQQMGGIPGVVKAVLGTKAVP
ncbi:hypothetical protein O3P69_012156 [Scylla paramamosain]|uniref:Uncharacterized protein n=1 Tax=Scylla paramamosain TaxID=85552 RepID=A0AAW0TCR5_SCYPA